MSKAKELIEKYKIEEDISSDAASILNGIINDANKKISTSLASLLKKNKVTFNPRALSQDVNLTNYTDNLQDDLHDYLTDLLGD